MATIVVIGAGVAGLSTALLLARKGHKIVIVAEHFPGDLSINYTSPSAAAQWLTAALTERDKEFDRITYKIFWEMANHPESGICKMESVEYFDRPLTESGTVNDGETEVWFKDFVQDLRILPPEELPEGVQSGMSLMTLSINPLIYLPYLQGQLLTYGTKIIRRHLTHISEAFQLTTPAPAIVVNATGLSALTLGGVEDANVYPTRGQLVLVSNECPRMYARSMSKAELGKNWTYIIPRAFGGGTILGGCRQDGNWSEEVDYEMANQIAKKCVAMYPELAGGKGVDGLHVVRHIVGLRPSRKGGCRLEIERLDLGVVVHNYGAGGCGYQSSWGMATKAMELVEEALKSS